jgi:hypothetical protein
MELTDLLSRVGVISPLPESGADASPPRKALKDPGGADGTRSGRQVAGAHLDALLPTSGVTIGPPELDDKLDLSPLAHAILRAVDQLEVIQSARVGELRSGFLREGLEVDADLLAARLMHQAFAESATEVSE